jgi:hypothetical protein
VGENLIFGQGKGIPSSEQNTYRPLPEKRGPILFSNSKVGLIFNPKKTEKMSLIKPPSVD